MSGEDRPWRLEVADLITGEWDTWSTYRAETNAAERANQLIDKGYDARVAYTGSCRYCGDVHPAPHDGGCLI